MKHTSMNYIKFFSIIFLYGLCSCSHHEDPSLTLKPENFYCTVDGSIISNAQLYCIPFVKESSNDSETDNTNTQIINSYDEFFFKIKLETQNQGFHFYDKNKDKVFQSELYNYLHSKADLLRDNWDYHSKNGDFIGYGMDEFFTAYINNKVEITCDKTLFGLPAGENLIKHLKIIDNHTCQPIGIVPPYSIIHCDEIENSIENSIFQDKAWLRFNYNIGFKNIPEEMYDVITFRLKLPIVKENASHYISSLMKGYESKPQYEEITYESEVKIKFKH